MREGDAQVAEKQRRKRKTRGKEIAESATNMCKFKRICARNMFR